MYAANIELEMGGYQTDQNRTIEERHAADLGQSTR